MRSVFLALILVFGSTGGSDISPSEEEKVVAIFEGRPLDIANDWEEAQACIVWPDLLEVVECFRTVEEADERLVELESQSGSASLLACSSSLHLYDFTYYGTPRLTIAGSGFWLNLSAYGFDNRTSSYQVGACDAIFADFAFGGGDWYPLALTKANTWSPTMISGWNNRVSSVFYP